MWHLLLSLCLLADAVPVDEEDEGPPQGVELTVWRTIDELPFQELVVTEDFNFKKELLAAGPGASNASEVVAPRFERFGADLYVFPTPVEPVEVTQCPPCRGVHTMELPLEKTEVAVLPPPIYRLPRTKGRVFEVRPLVAVVSLSCPPCVAP